MASKTTRNGNSNTQDPLSQLYSSRPIYFILVFLNIPLLLPSCQITWLLITLEFITFKPRDWAPFLSSNPQIGPEAHPRSLPLGVGYSALVRYSLLTNWLGVGMILHWTSRMGHMITTWVKVKMSCH